MNNQNAEVLIEKLLNYYNLTSLQELAEKLNIKQSSLSSWKSRNSINAIKKKCRELKIYTKIFEEKKIQEISKNSSDIELENKSDLSKYFTALESVAIATNKEAELVNDIKDLIKKYMQ